MANEETPGTLSLERLGANGPHYTLSVPAGYAPERPAPLVVSLHYGGPVLSPYYGRGLLETVVEPALRPLQALMLAPDCPARAWAEPACEDTVLALIEHVRASYAIDERRVVLTGYSKGGIGTWALAAKHPQRFSAAIAMAGRPPTALEAARWRVPLYVIHAREDEVLPIGPTTEAVKQLRAAGWPVEFEILEGVTHYETHRFAAALGRAVAWLQRVWDEGKQ